jgi:uncharacterized protein (UPF0335 family)
MYLTFQEVSEVLDKLVARVERLERVEKLQDDDIASVRTELGRVSGITDYHKLHPGDLK